jgi:hypothetical protein
MKTTKTNPTPELIICTYCTRPVLHGWLCGVHHEMTFTPEGMRELDRLDRLPLKADKEVA